MNTEHTDYWRVYEPMTLGQKLGLYGIVLTVIVVVNVLVF